MLNEEAVKKAAMGDEQTLNAINALPLPLRMSYGLAIDNYRRDNDVQPVENQSSLYSQSKRTVEISDDDLGQALEKRLEDKKIKEEILEKQRQEQAEKVAQQQAMRARILSGGY
ncbi:hypothetical protein [Priestia megaterium]|uniref:hypothetical protein n=1 Tax=Priestia megaterium TaxID=1404 RepID=UPI00244C1C8C|nr:hypothetical protein [Priestia megaterium]MDH2363129.1 hypothetical protein [Priestia megaterium]MDH2363138.1 hypothetical protein [Priestia megaterium]